MDTRLRRWGNSIGVRVPKEALVSSNLQLNDVLEVTVVQGGILLKKKTNKTFSDIPMPF